MAVILAPGPIFGPSVAPRGGFNFSVRVGNGTTNPDFASFISDAALFMSTDYLQLKTQLGAEYVNRDGNTTSDSLTRYACIAGSGQEVRDNLGHIGKPAIWTTKGAINNNQRAIVINPTTSTLVDTNFTADSFDGTVTLPNPSEFGWQPGSKLSTLAPILPTLPLIASPTM